MTDIYDQHRAAFRNVEAYVILKDGERVANIAFKFPRDGAGRLYAYVHWFGLEMVRGSASGGGYDKRTAACANAIAKLGAAQAARGLPDPAECDKRAAFAEALAHDTGPTWDAQLRKAGFTVLQAV